MSLKVLADELAKHGRFGDTQLLHVHKDELAGLASLAPNGKLTINPKTGLPEAFFFLPFLASLLGGGAAAAAPIAATALGTAGTAAAGGALASGLTAGLTAAGSAIPAAASAALPTVAAAAPTLTAAGSGLGAIGAGGSASGLASLAGVGSHAAEAAASAMPAAAAAAPAITAAAPAAAGTGLTGMAPAVMPVEATPGTGIGAFSGTAAPSSGLGGIMSTGIKGLANMNPLTMMMLGQGASSLAGLFHKNKSEDDGKTDISGTNYYSKGGVDPVFPGSNSGYKPGKSNEWDYFPGMKNGGVVKKYAQGGIASLGNPPPASGMLQGMPQSTMPAQQMGPNDPMQAGMSPDPNQIPASPYPKSQIGAPTDGDKELIAQTVAAIKGQHPNAQGILMAFVKQFGEQALQDLVARVRGAGQQQAAAGPSDGLSDSIPATIGGQQPAALSEGEFVVPSDVVSHLGNGSTDAGAGHLQNMVARTRAARGAPQTPPQIDANAMMPQ